jgi:hypothetical protein
MSNVSFYKTFIVELLAVVGDDSQESSIVRHENWVASVAIAHLTEDSQISFLRSECRSRRGQGPACSDCLSHGKVDHSNKATASFLTHLHLRDSLNLPCLGISDKYIRNFIKSSSKNQFWKPSIESLCVFDLIN